MPTPKPSTIVEGGPALASVTLTVPDCVAVNVRIAVPFGAIEPFKVSVAGDVGADGVVVVSLLLHAALNKLNRATARTVRAGHFMRVREREHSTASM